MKGNNNNNQNEENHSVGIVSPVEQAKEARRKMKVGGLYMLILSVVIAAVAWGAMTGYVQLWHIIMLASLYCVVKSLKAFYSARSISKQIPQLVEQEAEMEKELKESGLEDMAVNVQDMIKNEGGNE